MGLFDFWKTEQREEVTPEISAELLEALLCDEEITRSIAMRIPAVAASVHRISDTVASLPVMLYRKKDDDVDEQENDRRVKLLNGSTGDTLNAQQMKKALVMDMILSKGGYAYIHRVAGEIIGLYYVDPIRVSFFTGNDPIFKDYQIQVNGQVYEGWQFIKLLRSTVDGYRSIPFQRESPVLLKTIYNSLLYELTAVQTGGNKRGFIQATGHLDEKGIRQLREVFKNLYSNNTEKVVVLNEGLTFKESSESATDLQLNENRQMDENDVYKAFGIPPSIMTGGASDTDRKLYYEGCILPVVDKFESALNDVLLTESEKNRKYFKFDVSDLLKADIKTRYEAYEIGIKSGFMQIDEVRAKEDLPAFNLDFIKLGLQDVLYYPESGEVYTPNTGIKGDVHADPVEPRAPKDITPVDKEEDNADNGEK